MNLITLAGGLLRFIQIKCVDTVLHDVKGSPVDRVWLGLSLTR